MGALLQLGDKFYKTTDKDKLGCFGCAFDEDAGKCRVARALDDSCDFDGGYFIEVQKQTGPRKKLTFKQHKSNKS